MRSRNLLKCKVFTFYSTARQSWWWLVVDRPKLVAILPITSCVTDGVIKMHILPRSTSTAPWSDDPITRRRNPYLVNVQKLQLQVRVLYVEPTPNLIPFLISVKCKLVVFRALVFTKALCYSPLQLLSTVSHLTNGEGVLIILTAFKGNWVSDGNGVEA
jgi:hypothetical protein